MNKLLKSGIFWTIFIGAVTIIFSIVIFEFSNKNREPVYSISKQPSLIFDNSNASPKIKLLVNDSTLIKNNVYVISVLFWNNGKLEIKKEDIRKDFAISFSGKSKILDYKIVQQTKPEIANFSLYDEDEKIKINWDYFDPKFGLEIQIIYSAEENSNLSIEGYVLGAGVEEVTVNKISIFSIIVALLFLVFSIFVLKVGIKELKINKISGITAVILGTFIFFLSIYGIYDSLWNGVVPPF